MRTRLISSLAIAALALSACGGGDGKQDEVADLMIQAAADEDLELDEGCVRDVAGELSDDDAQKILDAGFDGDPQDLSAEAEDLANDMFGCVDTDALVDQFIGPLIEEMGEDNVDVDCIKEAMRGLDVSSPEDAAFAGAMMECVQFDFGG